MTTYKEAFDANPIVTLLDTDILSASRSPYLTAADDAGIDWLTLKENIQDLMNTTLVGGSNISITYDDPAGTLTFAFTGTLTEANIADGAVTNAKLADMAEATVKGRPAGAGTGDPTDLTQAQITALINAFTSSLSGAVPAASGGTNTANHALLGSGAFGQIIKTGTALLKIQGSVTVGTHAGDNETYARIGPLVLQGFDINWTNVDATGNLFLSGLPYTASGAIQGVFFNAHGITVTHTGTTCRILAGNTQIDIQKIAPSTGTLSNYTDADLPVSGTPRMRAVGFLCYLTTDAF